MVSSPRSQGSERSQLLDSAAAAPGRRARAAALALLVGLPLHWGLAIAVNRHGPEPWPVFCLPSFAATAPRGEVAVTVPLFIATLADGQERPVLPSEVFRALPRSLHGGIMREQFRRDTRGQVPGDGPSTVRWLLERSAEVLGESPRLLRVEWQRRVVGADGALVATTTTSVLPLHSEERR